MLRACALSSENRRHSYAHVLAQVHKLKGFGLHVVNTPVFLPCLPHILMLNDVSTATLPCYQSIKVVTCYQSKIFLVLVLRWKYTLCEWMEIFIHSFVLQLLTARTNGPNNL